MWEWVVVCLCMWLCNVLVTVQGDPTFTHSSWDRLRPHTPPPDPECGTDNGWIFQDVEYFYKHLCLMLFLNQLCFRLRSVDVGKVKVLLHFCLPFEDEAVFNLWTKSLHRAELKTKKSKREEDKHNACMYTGSVFTWQQQIITRDCVSLKTCGSPTHMRCHLNCRRRYAGNSLRRKSFFTPSQRQRMASSHTTGKLASSPQAC